MNGELTLGENIADNGAIHTAYQAYKNGNSNQTLPFGLSDQKLFFLSFAQVRFTRFFKLRMFLIISWQSWCSLFTTAHLKTSVTYDPYCNSSGPIRYVGIFTSEPPGLRMFHMHALLAGNAYKM